MAGSRRQGAPRAFDPVAHQPGSSARRLGVGVGGCVDHAPDTRRMHRFTARACPSGMAAGFEGDHHRSARGVTAPAPGVCQGGGFCMGCSGTVVGALADHRAGAVQHHGSHERIGPAHAERGKFQRTQHRGLFGDAAVRGHRGMRASRGPCGTSMSLPSPSSGFGVTRAGRHGPRHRAARRVPDCGRHPGKTVQTRPGGHAVRASLIQTLTVGPGIPPAQPTAAARDARLPSGRGL